MKMMKIGILCCSLGLSPTLLSQDIAPNALGIRLGSGMGFGPEISYQAFLKDNNRLELGLRMKDNQDLKAYKIKGLYEWVFPMPGEFQWYGGLGLSSGIVNFNSTEKQGEISSALFSLESVLGLEYSFKKSDMPIQLMLDVNPKMDLRNEYLKSKFSVDVSFGLRYIF